MSPREAWRWLGVKSAALSEWVANGLKPLRGWLIVSAAAIAVALISAMAEVQGILRGMHRPGAPVVDVGDLATRDANAAVEAARTWFAYERGSVVKFTDPRPLAEWFIYLDFGFAFFFSLVLAYGLAHLRSRLVALGADEVQVTRAAVERREKRGFPN